MPDTPYTQQRAVQYRGPSISDDYNRRIEESYNDITLLYNRIRLNSGLIDEGYSRFIKDQVGIMRLIDDLETRIAALEANSQTVVFYEDDQIDSVRFNSTPFAIADANKCTLDGIHGLLTLPLVPSSSISKLAFTASNGDITIPATLGTTVVGSGADSGNAVIDSSPPELAIARQVGSIWQRNVIVPNTVGGGAQLFLYIKAPTDLFTTPNSNCIVIHPYPAYTTDILDVAYTTNVNPTMSDADGYVNFPANYALDTDSVRWNPPGAWSGDADQNAGFRSYYFDPQPITGLRIKLGQRNYFYENGQYVYSYGASTLDLRYNKLLPTGQAIVRFDAPAATTISDVTSVVPQIFNVPQALIPEVFSYDLIWETAFNSGIYTTTPVPFSQRVWVRVTLNQTPGGGTPALSGLGISFQ